MKSLVLFLVIILSTGSAAAAQTATRPLQKPDGVPVLSLPEDVVRELYKAHRNGYGHLFDRQGRKQQQKFFEPKLAALIWKNATETPEGEIGRIDFDPLFNAQDTQIKNFRVGTSSVQGDTATVPVTFLNYRQRVKIDFRLVNTRAGWKISNIVYGGGVDFLKIMSEPL